MPDLFDPEAHGWEFQRGFPTRFQYLVDEDPSELGYVKSVAISERYRRLWPQLRWIAFDRDAEEYIRSFFGRLVGPAGRFTWQARDPVPSPDAAPVLDAVSSGNQAPRTISAQFAWKNANGLTKPSPAGSVFVNSDWLVRVTLPPYPPSVTQAVIYATQTGGTPQEQIILVNSRVWIQPNAALLVATSGPPTANTAQEIVNAKLSGEFEIVRGAGLSFELQLSIQEV